MIRKHAGGSELWLFCCLAVCGALIFFCGPASAAPNGLTQIPIAKVFGDGVAAFSVARAEEGSKNTLYTTQYGIDNVLEVGVDYQAAPSEQTIFLSNFKVLLAHRPGKLPDIAGGLQNVATGQKAVPYLVATTQPRATGFSLGLIRPGGGSYYAMGGISYNVTPAVQIVADEIGGRANYGTLGVIATVTKNVTLNVAYARPNTAGDPLGDGANPRGYVINLSYVFHLKGGDHGASGGSKNPTAGHGGTGS